jgi:hypothetical protein
MWKQQAMTAAPGADAAVHLTVELRKDKRKSLRQPLNQPHS